MKERETALNIDGVPLYRSIRQPSSHNYTSASSRMIHHIDTHDYILAALRQRKTIGKEFREERTAAVNCPVSLTSLCLYV